MRTPRDSTYARVAGGGDYDADWEEHYAPPPPPNLKRAAQAPIRPRMSPASPADSWSTTPPSSPPQDYYASTASAVVGAGSPLQRLDSVQIDPLPRVYSFEAMTSRSL